MNDAFAPIDNSFGDAPRSAPFPSATVRDIRSRVFDQGVAPFAFRHMDEIFDHRVVARGAFSAPWSASQVALAKLPDTEMEGQVFSFEQMLEKTFTNAILVVRDGKILWEQYLNRTTPDTRFAMFSVSKSLVSILVGIAVDRGLIRSIEDAVTDYLPELRGSAYDDVSIRVLLQMRSGSGYDEAFEERPGTAHYMFTESLVKGRERMADMARDIDRRHLPGAVFSYSTLDTSVLGWLLERAVGQPIASFMSTSLWEPAAMERDAFWIMDGPSGIGREASGMGFNAALRDLGRIGLLMLDGGALNGRRIVSEDWVRASTACIPTNDPMVGAGYGYQWWQIADFDAFSAVGLGGQYIYVHPRSRTVVVKASYVPNEQFFENIPVANALLETLCRWVG